MGTFREEEAIQMDQKRAVNEALNRVAAGEAQARMALQNGSLPGDPIVNGTFDGNNFVTFFRFDIDAFDSGKRFKP